MNGAWWEKGTLHRVRASPRQRSTGEKKADTQVEKVDAQVEEVDGQVVKIHTQVEKIDGQAEAGRLVERYSQG